MGDFFSFFFPEPAEKVAYALDFPFRVGFRAHASPVSHWALSALQVSAAPPALAQGPRFVWGHPGEVYPRGEVSVEDSWSGSDAQLCFLQGLRSPGQVTAIFPVQQRDR